LVPLADPQPEPVADEPWEPKRESRSKPIMVSGIVVSSAGVLVIGGGVLVLMGLGILCWASEDHGGETCGDFKSPATKAGLVTLAGAGILALGAPIIVYGAYPVVKQPH